MRYEVHAGQVSYGEPIGILLIENYAPYIPGDVANATTYPFPVRFERLNGFTPRRLFAHDISLVDEAIAAAKRLQREGVRAITGDCGFLALYQERIAAALDVPVFLSSLMQLDFIGRIIQPGKRIGVVTANREALTAPLLESVSSVKEDRLVIRGLENKPHFVGAVFDENGILDDDIVRDEVLATVDEISQASKDAPLGAILLECSLLPPYAAAVYQHTRLPVFDYITMISYVQRAVVPTAYHGYM